MNDLIDCVAHRVLVIDDNVNIREDFQKILGSRGPASSRLRRVEEELFGAETPAVARASFRIDYACQGQEAVGMVAEAMQANDPYAVAFVDLRMPPGWDGVETLEHIWSQCPDLQAVICTAYSDYSWDDLIQRFGHKDNLLIIKKPFETVEVLQVAHALARKWMLGRQTRLCTEDLELRVQERTQKLHQEVEQRTRAQQALRISEERFSKAFESSPMPMAIQSWPERRFLAVNTRFTELVGCGVEELLQGSGPDPGLWEGTALQAALESEGRIRNHSCCLRRSDGTTRNTRLSTEPITLDGRPCLLLVAQDVTDQLKMEAELRQAQKLEVVGRLVAGVAHEFNNVLTVIQGNAALLRDRLTGMKEPVERVEHIIEAARRAASITSQLLVFSRKKPMDFTAVDLSRKVQDLSRMMEQSLGERHSLKFELAAQLPPIHANVGCLEQVLVNLALNARDAMPGGGVITVRTSLAELSAEDAQRHPHARAGQFCCLTVSDTGHGIARDVIDRIFDPFFTTKEVGQGTGLGLSMVHSIVQQHRGWIEVSSEVDHGSSFSVFFPVLRGAIPAESDPEPEAPASARGAGEVVLLVEDEPTLREVARLTLEEKGYQVFEAADGREALEVWDSCPVGIDLLVTDMVMPNGVSGGELARTLQARVPGLPVICASGYSPEFIEGTLPSNPDLTFLQKPYLPHQLCEAVRRSLDRRLPTEAEPDAELAECAAVA
jgi:two-component system, cell cycle sensor histidine kinase and response regulator CckA